MKDNALLQLAMSAHGGYDSHRRNTGQIVIKAKTSGLALPLRGKPSAFREYEAHISTDDLLPETIIKPHPRLGQIGKFTRDNVLILSEKGAPVAERQNPLPLFRDFRHNFYWDDLDALYFAGYALWNYFNLPFLLNSPDIEIWDADRIEDPQLGSLRGLHASFPIHIPTHCRRQTFYFNDSGLLVRHDYTAEVFGRWAKAVHYSTEHKNFDGHLFATRRRVYPRLPSGNALRAILLVGIDVETVSLK